MPTPEILILNETKEWWEEAWVALLEDRRESAEVIEEYLRERGNLQKTTIHQFDTCEKFLDAVNFDDYSVCFIDGDFGDWNMAGHEAVSDIRARKPDMIIIGLTAQEIHLDAFRETDVDLAIMKDDLLTYIPQILALASPRE